MTERMSCRCTFSATERDKVKKPRAKAKNGIGITDASLSETQEDER